MWNENGSCLGHERDVAPSRFVSATNREGNIHNPSVIELNPLLHTLGICRTFIKGHDPWHLFIRPSTRVFGGPLMFEVNLPVVDTIHLHCNKFVIGVR